MSTRALYTFRDNDGSYNVYKHHDGYPTGAAIAILNALTLAWVLPRYEADEFAAGFVAANKLPVWCDTQILEGIQKENMQISVECPYKGMRSLAGGGIRLMSSGIPQDIAPCDIEFRYEIYPGNADGEVRVKAFETNYWDDEKKERLLFDCEISKIQEVAQKHQDEAEEE